MLVPRENALAFFPKDRAAGNVTLHPLTLAGVVALADAGIDIAKPIYRSHIFIAAYILSRKDVSPAPREDGSAAPSQFPRFLRRARCGLKELANAVEGVLNDAYETFVKPAKSGRSESDHPSGLGWPLEIAELLCSEYGWSWRDAVNTPVVTAHALIAAARKRHGGKSGFDYIEKDYIRTMRNGRSNP